LCSFGGSFHPYDKDLKFDATKEERKKYKKELESHINDKFKNLNGFVLFDQKNRYRIDFPKGW